MAPRQCARAAALLALAAALSAASSSAAAPDPRAVAARAAAAYFALFNASSRMQTVENYGPSIAHMALYSVARDFAQPQWAAPLDALLDAAAAAPGRAAYSILNNISVPWGYSIGDTAGLFPISYLARAEYRNASFASYTPDWQMVMNTARSYVLGWPERLADGTISRAAGWAGQPANNLSTFLCEALAKPCAGENGRPAACSAHRTLLDAPAGPPSRSPLAI